MPVDSIGEVIAFAAETAIEAVVDIPEPARRSRFWRIVYWSVLGLIMAGLGFCLYLALG